MSEAEMERLQSLLDKLPAPLEPLDISMLDGYLCGVLLQPKAVPDAQWLPAIFDSEGRPIPPGLDLAPAKGLILRRHKELNQAISQRQWFDPWVFELEEDADPSEVLMPWVAGFSLATELFPALMKQDGAELLEPLAMLYMHIDPDDLEDADELLEEIESMEPPADLEAAVESLVVATMLLADVARPQKDGSQMNTAARRPPQRKGPPVRGRY
ncbi:YecA family protein [Paucibacter sp. JuS9]|uniref:YecA/YgfB family protein n=1 Tax=Paucibacter sp. JuS9 TaxID=3228748 RepID=UPI003757A965